jgi:hypothetical protein
MPDSRGCEGPVWLASDLNRRAVTGREQTDCKADTGNSSRSPLGSSQARPLSPYLIDTSAKPGKGRNLNR